MNPDRHRCDAFDVSQELLPFGEPATMTVLIRSQVLLRRNVCEDYVSGLILVSEASRT
jgi:hypothetical protein